MLMGHPPQIITRGRENILQGCFEGLTPVQVPMVVQELVPSDSKMQEALADTLEAVQEIAQAGPHAFHCVTVNTRAVRVTTSILARTMVDRTMIIVSIREMVDDHRTVTRGAGEYARRAPDGACVHCHTME